MKEKWNSKTDTWEPATMKTKETRVTTAADRAKDPYLSADSIVHEQEKHSPGPFSVVGVRPPFTIHAALPGGGQSEKLATVYHECNLPLFSAAPDLLEACKLAEKHYLPTPVLIAIRNAILKAGGEL